jgi:hypothetical protein
MAYWYMASPFTKYPHGPREAWKLACKENLLLIKAGIAVYSPIAHTVGVELSANEESDIDLGPEAWRFWMDYDHHMMEAACGLIMLQADGWDISKGMREEFDTFHGQGKPIVWMAPGVIPFDLRPVTMEDILASD